MIAIGDEVKIVNGAIYLGKWIPDGKVGTVVGRKHGSGGHLYFVEIDSEIYTFAQAEIEAVEK